MPPGADAPGGCSAGMSFPAETAVTDRACT
ncbi:hypothetical protein BX257_8181 [Streptomyces sp. 3212.3]|nr:hypothetical protein BX257_8181 [Streptomyces sp. 3212.3]